MAFTTTSTLKGPAGDAGVAGLGYSDADLGGADGKHLILLDTVNTPHDVGSVVGVDGINGADAIVRGSVATVADLTALAATAAEGDAYIVEADGHLYRFDGAQFTDVGGLAGPRGDVGPDGIDGKRGVSWFAGTGTPADDPKYLAGDKYLDVATGQIYTFGAGAATPLAAYRLLGAGTEMYVLKLGDQDVNLDNPGARYSFRFSNTGEAGLAGGDVVAVTYGFPYILPQDASLGGPGATYTVLVSDAQDGSTYGPYSSGFSTGVPTPAEPEFTAERLGATTFRVNLVGAYDANAEYQLTYLTQGVNVIHRVHIDSFPQDVVGLSPDTALATLQLVVFSNGGQANYTLSDLSDFGVLSTS